MEHIWDLLLTSACLQDLSQVPAIKSLSRSILADLRITALLDSSTNPQLKYRDDSLRAVRPSFRLQKCKQDVDASSDCYWQVEEFG
jgi:hypothetical protein